MAIRPIVVCTISCSMSVLECKIVGKVDGWAVIVVSGYCSLRVGGCLNLRDILYVFVVRGNSIVED